MTRGLDDRLVDTLRRHADLVGDGPGFVASDVLRTGRATVRRRRRIRTGAAGLMVIAVAAVSWLAVDMRRDGRPPAHPSPTPSATSGPAPAAARFDLLAGDTLYLTDGTLLPLPLPAGFVASAVARVPTGWVFSGYDLAGEFNRLAPKWVWFLPDRAAPRQIGQLRDFRVSPAGTMLAGTDAAGSVAAYTLPDLTKIGQTTFETTNGPGLPRSARTAGCCCTASPRDHGPPGPLCGIPPPARWPPPPARSGRGTSPPATRYCAASTKPAPRRRPPASTLSRPARPYPSAPPGYARPS